MTVCLISQGSGEWLLECNGIVKNLHPPAKPNEKWELKYADSGIPFLTDGSEKLWAMTVFQTQQKSTVNLNNAPPELDISKIDESTASDTPKAKAKEGDGVVPGMPQIAASGLFGLLNKFF